MSTSIRSLGVADSNRIEDFSESNPKSALLALRARRETALNYIPVHTELTELLQNSRDSLSESERRSLESVLSRVRDGIEAVQLLQDATTTMDDTRAWCPHNVAYETLRDAGDNRATAYQRIIDESIETYRLYQDFVKKYDQDATSKTAPVPARVLEAMKGLSQLVQTPSIRGYTEDRDELVDYVYPLMDSLPGSAGLALALQVDNFSRHFDSWKELRSSISAMEDVKLWCGTRKDSGKFAEDVYQEELRKHSEVLTNASSVPALVVHPDVTALGETCLPVGPGLMASTVKINNAMSNAKTQLGLLLSECRSGAGTA